MLGFLRKFFLFRVSQRATSMVARKVGFPRAAFVLGLIGGAATLMRRP